MSNLDIKAFVAALAWRTPKERAAAWRKLTPGQCHAAWTLLTPQQRQEDGEALATAWIEEANDPDAKRNREAHITAAHSLAAKGLIADVGRRDGQVATMAIGHLPPEKIEGLLEGLVKHRALGANAFHHRLSITDNPHPADTPEHQNWDLGFHAARTIADSIAAERLH
jgi:hypothetical protein